MKEKIIYILLITFLALGLGLNGTASADRDDFNRPPTKEQKEKIRERIETLKVWKLTKALDLDEKTAAILFPIFHEYDKRRDKIERDIRSDMIALREALEDKRAKKIGNILDALENKHKALQRLNDDERSELKTILTIEQQAEYIIFKQKFKKDIRKVIAEARSKRHKRFADDMPGKPFSPEAR